MGNPNLAGSVFDSAGVAVSGITVNVYAGGDTATVIATTTTGAGGGWAVTNSSVGNPDVELVNGTEITRFKFTDRIALTGMDAQSYNLRTSSGTSSFDLEILAPSGGFSQDLRFRMPDNLGSSEATILTGAQFQTGSNLVQGTGVTLYKAADQSQTDSTLTNDTHLQFAAASATTYEVQVGFTYTQPGSSGDLIAKWNIPSGANLKGVWLGGIDGTSPRLSPVTEASSAAFHTGSSATLAGGFFSGYLESSGAAGTLAPQWRQQDADASATTIYTGSWMSVRQVSS